MSKLVGFGEAFFSQLGAVGASSPRSSSAGGSSGSRGHDVDGASTVDGPVTDFQLGSKFTAVLSSSGNVFLTGGLGGTVFPKLVKVPVRYPLKCVQIAAGRKHVLMLTEGNHVLSFGIGYFGQLGHGSEDSYDAPELVKLLEPAAVGGRVAKVACGGSHSGVVLEDGRVFMFGLSKQGQCGVGPRPPDSVTEPRPVDLAGRGQALKATALVCGRNHSAILTTDGRLLTFGAASFGRLGLGTLTGNEGSSSSSSSAAKKCVTSPTEVPYFRSNAITLHSVAAGDMHMAALSHDCAVYCWGLNGDGQCASGDLLNVLSPKKVAFFDASMQVTQVACGSTWSMAATAQGDLYGWGCNACGALGIDRPAYPERLPVLEAPEPGEPPSSYHKQHPRGAASSYKHVQCFDSPHNVLLPVRVRLLRGFHVDKVRCGGSHTVAFVTARAVVDDGDEKDAPDSDAKSHKMADAVVANGSFGAARHSGPVNSRQDAKAEPKTGTDVAATLATYDTDELTAQCISWARHRRTAEIDYALSRGADVNVRDASGATMLMVAAQAGHAATLRLLIDRKADLNLQNNKGFTALHLLFAHGFEALADVLVEAGADDLLPNLEGFTCYELADGLID